jgi:hypothetical protein
MIKERVISEIQRLDELVKGIYVWIGQFEKEVSNPALFSKFVDELLKLKWTMSERFAAADNLAGYYKQMTKESPPEYDLKRLFDWTREGYNPDDYPCYSDSELKRRAMKYEKVTYDVDYHVQKDKKVKRKGAMVHFDDPLNYYVKEDPRKNFNPHRVYVRL